MVSLTKKSRKVTPVTPSFLNSVDDSSGVRHSTPRTCDQRTERSDGCVLSINSYCGCELVRERDGSGHKCQRNLL